MTKKHTSSLDSTPDATDPCATPKDGPSLGALPQRVTCSPTGDFWIATEGHDAAEDSQVALERTLRSLSQAMMDPAKDDLFVISCTQAGQFFRMRIVGDGELEAVPHPESAATQLEPAAQSFVDTLTARGDLGHARVDAKDLARRLRQLRRARRLHAAFSPVVRDLDLLIRNLEQGIDGTVREGYDRISSIVRYDAYLQEALAPVEELVSGRGRRASETRRNNLRRDYARATIATPTTPVVPTTPVASAPPAPIATLTLPASPPAPRRKRSRPRR